MEEDNQTKMLTRALTMIWLLQLILFFEGPLASPNLLIGYLYLPICHPPQYLLMHRLWGILVGNKQCRKNWKLWKLIILGILSLILITNTKPIGCKWFYSVKLKSDGSLDRYKARLVDLGNKQEYRINYEETFAPMSKMTTVQTIIAVGTSQSWSLLQMNVKKCLFTWGPVTPGPELIMIKAN